MKISILLSVLFLSNLVAHAGDKSIHVMTLQGDQMYRCTVFELKDGSGIMWKIQNFETSEEKEILKTLKKGTFKSFWNFIKKSEDFESNNQIEENGDMGLDDGYIVALRNGNKKAKVYDLPPDLQSQDLEELKNLIHWEEVQNEVEQGTSSDSEILSPRSS